MALMTYFLKLRGFTSKDVVQVVTYNTANSVFNIIDIEI